MRMLDSTRLLTLCRWTFLLAVVIAPQALQAQWRATVGAESHDKARQALAFLPSEIWIHAGDNVTWQFATEEIHTVTFLKNGQVRLPFDQGCPGFTSNPATFDGSTCVTTPPLVKGQAFTVNFPTVGNFKLVCLVHANMTAAVHVLAAGLPLPHGQDFYDHQSDAERNDVLNDDKHDMEHAHGPHGGHTVVAGIGEVSATAGGTSTLSVNRFLDSPIVIHVGETVEWTNLDPVTPHTITFGAEPPPQTFPAPSANVTIDADGARHAVIGSTSDKAHSGFIVAAAQERIGLPQGPLGVTRFRVTFPKAGTFPYICALHDELGMKGVVIVRP